MKHRRFWRIACLLLFIIIIICKYTGIIKGVNQAGVVCIPLFLCGWESIANKKQKALVLIYGFLLLAALGVYIANYYGMIKNADAVFWMPMFACATILIGSADPNNRQKKNP